MLSAIGRELYSTPDPTALPEAECDELLHALCETHDDLDRWLTRLSAATWRPPLHEHLYTVCTRTLLRIFGNVAAILNSSDSGGRGATGGRTMARFRCLPFSALRLWMNCDLEVASENDVLFMLSRIEAGLSPEQLAELSGSLCTLDLTQAYVRHVLPHTRLFVSVADPNLVTRTCCSSRAGSGDEQLDCSGVQMQWLVELARLERLGWATAVPKRTRDGLPATCSHLVRAPTAAFCNGIFFNVACQGVRDESTGTISLYIAVYVDVNRMRAELPWWTGREAVRANVALVVGRGARARSFRLDADAKLASIWTWRFPSTAGTMREVVQDFLNERAEVDLDVFVSDVQ